MSEVRQFREELCDLYALWCDRTDHNPRRSVSRFEFEMELAPGSAYKVLRGERKVLEADTIDRLLKNLYEEGRGVLADEECALWHERLYTARAVELTKSHVIRTPHSTARHRLLTRLEEQFSDFYVGVMARESAATSLPYPDESVDVVDEALLPLLDNLRTALRRTTQQEVRRAAEGISYYGDWVKGRLYISQFDMVRAVPQMKWVVEQTESDRSHEWRNLIHFDMADASAIAGDLCEADQFATTCEQLSRAEVQHLLACSRPHTTQVQRAYMGVARALVMKQEVAYERGCWDDCWRWHIQAQYYLTKADDRYGWAKSYFFLSLFQFWRGDLAAAAETAREARIRAKQIQPKWEFWWGLRDGLFIGAPWWRVITRAHLLDVLACSGAGDSREFSELLLAHQRQPRPFTRDLPPFMPRYLWIAELEAKGHAYFERRLKQWVTQSATLGCKHLHIDMLLSYGDFLRWAKRDEEGALAIYHDAYVKGCAAKSPSNHYLLLVTAAEQRLNSTAPPFPGLARLGA